VTVGIKAQKTLWGRGAGRCSLPLCRQVLFEDDAAADDPTLIGENCHIVADADNGPRANPLMPLEERDAYPNLILCCRNHHKIIDDQIKTYTVDCLHKIKNQHETWVREQLGVDMMRQRDDELYAGYVEEWERLAHVGDWQAWTSYLLSHGQPSLWANVDSDLRILRRWLISRIWPDRYPMLRDAFINFHRVLNDLQATFHQHLEDSSESDTLWTRKFYQIKNWDPVRYRDLGDQYNSHVELVEDLTLELTRAANLVCDRIREFLTPSYKINEGRLLITTGPGMNFEWHTFSPLYSSEEKSKIFPYPGLGKFKAERQRRD